MKKILIIGEKFSTNLGDGIICEEVEHILSKDFKIHTLDLSGREEYQIERKIIKFNINNERKIHIKNFIRKILNSIGIKFYGYKSKETFIKYQTKLNKIINEFNPDAIVFAGGQMFMDCFLNQIEFTINIAEKKKINVIFNACGIGKIQGIKNKHKIKNMLNKNIIKYISVRDNYEYIKKITKLSNIIETYDTAILCNDIYEKAQTSSKIGIGIMLSRITSVEKQIKFWKEMLEQIERSSFEWEIFCNGSDADYAFAKYLLKELNLDEKKLTTQPTTPNELIFIITKYNKIISMRLHSLIIAYSHDIPAIAISWDKKINDFYKKINKETYCFNLNDDSKTILKKFKEMNNSFVDKEKKIKIISKINENIYNIKEIIKQRSDLK